MFERWLKAPPAGSQSGTRTPRSPRPSRRGGAPAPGANTKPWELSIGTVAVDNGALSYADKASDTPVAFELSALKVKAQKITPNTATVSPLEVSGRIAAGRAEPGRFDYNGKRGAQADRGRRPARRSARIPAHAFKAYYADALEHRHPPRLRELPGHGQVREPRRGPERPAGRRHGARRLPRQQRRADPGARPVDASNQLLSWKTLSLRGVQVDMVPSAPLGCRRARDHADRLLRPRDHRSDRPPQSAGPGQEAGAAGSRAAAAAPAAERHDAQQPRRHDHHDHRPRPAARRAVRRAPAELMVGGAARRPRRAAPAAAAPRRPTPARRRSSISAR